MTTKTLLLLCVVFLFKAISAYCTNLAWASGLPLEDLGWTSQGFAYETPLAPAASCSPSVSFLGAYDLAASPFLYGGGFAISSASPAQPYGVSVISENEIEGILAVGGELPFLGTVGLEGALPTNGAGAVAYGCGDGNVGIVSGDSAVGLGWPTNGFSYGPVMANGLKYAGDWPGFAFGCACGDHAVY